MLNPNINIVDFTEEEYSLYSKHIILNEIGLNGQKRLKTAKVLVVGAGGLGCPILLYLTLSGIGYIGLIDDDNINLSNLTRQILYTHKDINNKKARSAQHILKNINPNVKIITHICYLNYYNAKEIIQYYDIIIDGSDNFITRYSIDYICYKLHKVHIYGAVQEFNNQISVCNYQGGHRYSDIYPRIMNLTETNCNNSGILGIITGQTGIKQTTETIKLIIGHGQILKNKLRISNSYNLQQKTISIYQLKYNFQINFLYNDKKTKISDYLSYNLHEVSLIIDIRDNEEFLAYHLSHSINIPLNLLIVNKSIFFLTRNYKNKILSIYCNTMYRSLIASHILQYNKIECHVINSNRYNKK
uniref:Molybdopterin biosynthesis protein n=1 Tax=Nitophyllum punctatum TaxID=158729 RepID=A0A4D6WUS4_9FLOR|nr:Molybdopterin biosynthesis protein [Nitophyllum punctatum]